ncbi:MAG: rhodanese-like domain-containing protein [Candidatus Thiodiazotropha sp.]
MNLKSSLTQVSALLLTLACGSAIADGNRYNIERFYHSEISAAEAFLRMQHRGGPGVPHGHHRGVKPVLVDVRSMEEYSAGHPDSSYNIPYPRVCSGCDAQTPEVFYWEVYETVRGNTEREIFTLCRTGSRSVSAGNILANPAEYGIDGPAFTQVRNIWEGFVGQYKYAYDGGTVMLDTNGEPFALDLNNNGDMDSDTADVYQERSDANPDKDGWRNFQKLPWTTEIQRRYAYMGDTAQYGELTLTPVD